MTPSSLTSGAASSGVARAFSTTPRGCSSCGRPDAPLHPHSRGGERLCVPCFAWVTAVMATFARFGWRDVAYQRAAFTPVRHEVASAPVGVPAGADRASNGLISEARTA